LSDYATADDEAQTAALVQVPQQPAAGPATRIDATPPSAAPRRRSRPTLAALLITGDAAALALGVLGAAWIAGWRDALLLGGLAGLGLLLAPHRRWRFTLSALDDLPLITGAVGAATLAVVTALAVLDRTFETTERVLHTAAGGAGLLVAVLVGRAITYAVAHRLRSRGIGAARAIIVGTGRIGTALGRVLGNDNHHGVEFVGYVDDVPAPVDGRTLLGTLESLPNVVRDLRVDLVLIAFGASGCHAVVDPVRSIRPADCEVYVVPRLYELHDRAVVTDLVNGIPLVRLRRLAFRSPSWRVKRALDVLAAAVGLIVIAPLLLALAIAVRIETGPGVIFKQLRVGRDGRPFTLYKFRSLKPVDGEDATRWTIDGDARVGKVGTFIRSSSLDELPQLVNILRGDMSLVGPRPERPHFVNQFEQSIPGYRHRHRMPAGLTGLAAVHGLRGDTGIQERAHLDNIYAESWSLWLDIKIIIRTAAQLLAPRRHRRIRRRKDALS
jgi:exopolysaccharide biosynthesis polyprenyl glycosylphosphotransferase